ncbi:MAG: alpha/beta fold hydrolase [Bacteroidales bacterium]|jgi:pimeloyl-ACP methyl ester carboxylesterase|nr:alpha/beta fold hydrolase [Bacteroidales bacterium]MCK9449391.1 alpha/beta fold hydrolase [Bacteroidales bacterium]MDD3701737.1 alpha/beta fold hydrolase [Bacteroidales bacterium]MDY0370099.1 alpha/beta fold hydrolase [Bacteroidales bacterium]
MKLFFRKYGQSGYQPLIILHGLFGNSDNWVSYARRIADEGFEVFIPDQRNHGLSPHSEIFNYPAMTDDLLEMMEDQSISRPIILGHSMGGKVAMFLALEYPESVHKLVVVDISLKAYGSRPYHQQLIQAMQAVDLNRLNSRQAIDHELQKEIKELRIRQFLMKNLHWRDKEQLEWRLNLQGIGQNLTQMFDAIETSTKFTKPSLFIRGGASDYILPEDYPQIRWNFPYAEIITIEGASHWVHADSAEQFYLISSGFMNDDKV